MPFSQKVLRLEVVAQFAQFQRGEGVSLSANRGNLDDQMRLKNKKCQGCPVVSMCEGDCVFLTPSDNHN